MRTINRIVIHCSATRSNMDYTAKQVDTAHKAKGFRCWGYHYYIRKSGQIELMRPLEMVGAHAKGYNLNSVGICYEGGLDINGVPSDTRKLEQKAIEIAPTSPAKHLAFFLKLKKLNTSKAINKI